MHSPITWMELIAQAIKKIDTVHPVFALLAYSPPNIFEEPPDFDQWWKRFADNSDVSVMDNYPLTWANAQGLATDPTGKTTNVGLGEMIDVRFALHYSPAFCHDLGHTIGWNCLRVQVAVKNSNESKPVWPCLQTMENWLSGIFTWRMPTTRDIRAMAYVSIVHGATGLMYFAMDSFIVRDSGVIGIAPRELSNTSWRVAPPNTGAALPGVLASAELVEMSVALWDGVARLNKELSSLVPVLFSNTSRLKYTVGIQHASTNKTVTPVHSIRKVDGDTLIAVNIDEAQLFTVRFTMPLPDSKGYRVEVVNENRFIVPCTKTQVRFDTQHDEHAAMCAEYNRTGLSYFEDEFEPLQVHIYKLANVKVLTSTD